MVPAVETKLVSITPPAAIIDNASLTTAYVDTWGYSFLTVVVYLGATDIAMSALKLQECDTSGGSYTDVTGMTYGTDVDIAGDTSVLPSATDDNGFFVFELDLRGHKRYIDLVATVGDGTAGAYVTALALLSRPSDTPTTATERGCVNILRG